MIVFCQKNFQYASSQRGQHLLHALGFVTGFKVCHLNGFPDGAPESQVWELCLNWNYIIRCTLLSSLFPIVNLVELFCRTPQHHRDLMDGRYTLYFTFAYFIFIGWMTIQQSQLISFCTKPSSQNFELKTY